MPNTLSVYLSNHHDYSSTFAYIAALDPTWVNIHQPTARAIFRVQEAAPNARILLRSWDIDDHNGDRKREMYDDPVWAARRHLAMWDELIAELIAEASRNNWRLDPSRWTLGLVNEPDPNYVPQLLKYSLEAMRVAGDRRLGVVASSVGTLPVPGEAAPGWEMLKPLEHPINAGGHVLLVHEYWDPDGLRAHDDAGWLAWRHHKIPLNVPILIREAGANGFIFNRHTSNDDGGWQRYMQPHEYAAQVKEYIEGCDQRVQGVCLYMTDYHSEQWRTFDTTPAHDALLAIIDARPQKPSPFASKPNTTHLPSVPNKPSKPATVPALAHPIQDPARRGISQRFGENPQDYARFGLAGHTGIDFAVPVGTPVVAIDDGVAVEMLSDVDGYGRYIKLKHAWGESLYAHLDRYHALIPGAKVTRGQMIGLSGNTGNSTGPHLHFAMRVNPYQRGAPFDGFVDPAPYLINTAAPQQPAQPTLSHKEIVEAITQAALEFDVDSDLLLSLAWGESSFNPRAVSEAGAIGLMQIMPGTFAEWAPKVGATDPLNIRDNVRTAAKYMASLLKHFNGDARKAIWAYNFGPGNVSAGRTPPPETIEFASKVLHGRDLLKVVGA